jgi:2-polyprenyl-3-methyl-5-hydroxy-6-metoxy-1,4-benzoquinol methylase
VSSYDLIIGRAVLHHVDYQQVLRQLYDNNLNPGGKMFFI